jgi:glycine/D-amino acid oxidase-like deaminating enzyme
VGCIARPYVRGCVRHDHGETTDIAVIGAGVVGLTIALELLDAGPRGGAGRSRPPGMGASYGNAGTIAGYATSPVGTPDVLRSLPSLLFSRRPRRWRSATGPCQA